MVTLSCLLLLSCTVVDGEGRYRIATIGNAERSVSAIVIAAQPVSIQIEPSGVGAASGGAIGAAIALHSNNNAGVIILGILGGVIIGSAVEDSLDAHEATEYVIETETNLILNVAQINKNNTIFQVGDKVRLMYGYPGRLITDDR